MLAWTRLDSSGLAWEKLSKLPFLPLPSYERIYSMLAWTRLDSFGLAWGKWYGTVMVTVQYGKVRSFLVWTCLGKFYHVQIWIGSLPIIINITH